MEGFVYNYTYHGDDSRGRKYYIGSHVGSLDDGYTLGGSWGRVSEVTTIYDRDPSLWTREILESGTYATRSDLYEVERKYLLEVNASGNPEYFNKSDGASGVSSNHKHYHDDIGTNYMCLPDDPRIEDLNLKLGRAGYHNPANSGRVVYNDGVRNYYLEPDDPRVKDLSVGCINNLGCSGHKWYNNGSDSLLLAPHDLVPEGYNPGRIMVGKELTVIHNNLLRLIDNDLDSVGPRTVTRILNLGRIAKHILERDYEYDADGLYAVYPKIKYSEKYHEQIVIVLKSNNYTKVTFDGISTE